MKNDILKYITYFDIFDHPLKKEELLFFFSIKDDSVIDSVLTDLVKSGLCYTHNEYYSLQSNIENLIRLRIDKEKSAQPYFKRLPFFARLIKSFPFVEGIAISGSLSKNVMHEDGDIDYFIITSKGRLWICRTFLVVFKKLFLLNSKKYFCVNYFVDTENLKILDENIFTAIELRHLLPVYNLDLISKLKQENLWTNNYVEYFENPVSVEPVKGKGVLKKVVSFLLKGKIGDRLDLFFMKFTYKKWEKKFKHFDAGKFDLTMRTNRGISKHHPRDFQNKVLKEYHNRLNKIVSRK